MASVFTPNINLEEPANGDDINTWSTPMNNNFTGTDNVLGASTSLSFTNSNINLTVAQAAYFSIICTGILTGNVQLILPTIGGRRVIFNQCTGAFTLSVLNGGSDTGGGVTIPQSASPFPVVLSGNRAWYDSYSGTPPGTLLDFAGTTAPPGFLLAFGQAISRGTYAQLFSAIGTTWGIGDGSTTFNLPDLRGRLTAGADNMGGTPAGNLTGYTVGTVGGEQTHLLSTPEMPSHNHTDSGHSHTITDPGHAHGPAAGQTNFIEQVNGAGVGGFSSGTNPVWSLQSLTGTATTGITNQTGHAIITNTGGGGAHNNIQPTAAINKMIRY